MQLYVFFGAALLALLASLPALAHKQHWTVLREFWGGGLRRVLWDLASCELGTIVVTYWTRGPGVATQGSATPITAAAAQQVMKQSAIVQFGVTADTAATFTHNWGLDISADQYIEPEILWEFLSTALTTFSPLITFSRSNTNAVFINKPATGDACTLRVTLRRPHSMGQ